MAFKKKIIKMPVGKPAQLAKAMGCTVACVYSALSYNTSSELAVKIRKEALTNYGGIESSKVVW